MLNDTTPGGGWGGTGKETEQFLRRGSIVRERSPFVVRHGAESEASLLFPRPCPICSQASDCQRFSGSSTISRAESTWPLDPGAPGSRHSLTPFLLERLEWPS